MPVIPRSPERAPSRAYRSSSTGSTPGLSPQSFQSVLPQNIFSPLQKNWVTVRRLVNQRKGRWLNSLGPRSPKPLDRGECVPSVKQFGPRLLSCYLLVGCGVFFIQVSFLVLFFRETQKNTDRTSHHIFRIFLGVSSR